MATYPQDKPISYREVYFTHTTLRAINGNLTCADIQQMYKQVKANAASVPITLGGGQHGHLGLTTNATTYTRIASTPYVRPTAPTTLGPNNIGTAAQIDFVAWPNNILNQQTSNQIHSNQQRTPPHAIPKLALN